jgi:hypothetical protein
VAVSARRRISRLAPTDPLVAQWKRRSSETAMLKPTKAPQENSAPCAKLSTSISPKISVRPDATRKISIPMARPATLSVR